MAKNLSVLLSGDEKNKAHFSEPEAKNNAHYSKVLAHVSHELTQLNAAARSLRQMGYVIVAEQLPLNLQGERPLIQLQSGQDMQPLLALSKGLFSSRKNDHLMVHTELQGVLICWSKPLKNGDLL